MVGEEELLRVPGTSLADRLLFWVMEVIMIAFLIASLTKPSDVPGGSTRDQEYVPL
jgi:hypothetical protein